eukprot:1351857-Prymnesium_polylepis.2
MVSRIGPCTCRESDTAMAPRSPENQMTSCSFHATRSLRQTLRSATSGKTLQARAKRMHPIVHASRRTLSPSTYTTSAKPTSTKMIVSETVASVCSSKPT